MSKESTTSLNVGSNNNYEEFPRHNLDVDDEKKMKSCPEDLKTYSGYFLDENMML